ncbi:MAG: nitrous oxide reductase family maturation protein NosD [Anaerolineae bacterium]
MLGWRGFLAGFLAGLLVAGCGASSGGEGEVGIPFANGVECLGEEAAPSEQEVVFVSPDGRDDNPGTETATWQTLAHALCQAQPGQTINILPGVYRESVVMGLFGSADFPITIQGVPDGDELPILDGEGMRTMGIGLVESANIVIANLEFRNYTDEGLYVLVGEDMVIRGNRFVGNGRASIDPEFDGEGFGVQISGGKRIIIENNEASQNGPGPDRVADGILGTGIDTYELEDSIIRDNYSHHNTGGGMLVEDSINVLVAGNRIEANELDANGDYWDGGIWVDGGHDITLRGNEVRDNHGPGIELSDEDVRYPDNSYGYVLENNTIANNEFGLYIWNWGQCLPPETAVILQQNDITNNTQQDVWCAEWMCGEGEACE